MKWKVKRGWRWSQREEEVAARQAEGRRRVEAYRAGLESLREGERPQSGEEAADPGEPARRKQRSKHLQPPADGASREGAE